MKRDDGVLLKRWPSGYEDRAHIDKDGDLRLVTWNDAGITQKTASLLTADSVEHLRALLNQRAESAGPVRQAPPCMSGDHGFGCDCPRPVPDDDSPHPPQPAPATGPIGLRIALAPCRKDGEPNCGAVDCRLGCNWSGTGTAPATGDGGERCGACEVKHGKATVASDNPVAALVSALECVRDMHEHITGEPLKPCLNCEHYTCIAARALEAWRRRLPLAASTEMIDTCADAAFKGDFQWVDARAAAVLILRTVDEWLSR